MEMREIYGPANMPTFEKTYHPGATLDLYTWQLRSAYQRTMYVRGRPAHPHPAQRVLQLRVTASGF